MHSDKFFLMCPIGYSRFAKPAVGKLFPILWFYGQPEFIRNLFYIRTDWRNLKIMDDLMECAHSRAFIAVIPLNLQLYGSDGSGF